MEPNLTESVAQVIRALPPIIRSYIAQEKYVPIVRVLMEKYSLRVDQASVLEREAVFVLIGIKNPNEFTEALAEEAQLDQQTINGIVEDINDQIFVPLREQMRNEANAAQRPVQSAAAQPPRVAVQAPPRPPQPVNAQVPMYTSPLQQRPYAPAPTQAPAVPPVAVPAAPSVPAAPPVRIPPAPTVAPVSSVPRQISKIAPLPPKLGSPRFILAGEKLPPKSDLLLEDHEEPHIEFHTAPVRPPSTARTAPPPPNLPGAMEPAVTRPEPVPAYVPAPRTAPSFAPAEPPRVQQTPAGPAASGTMMAPTQTPPMTRVEPSAPPQAKPFRSDDPYREPIEENGAV